MELKYGINPNQKPAWVSGVSSGYLPFTVLNGKPGYINLLDALNSWQLVRELDATLGKPSAASFKHVSPAGAAIADTLSDAYRRARNCDPVSSYGDWIALSRECDLDTAMVIKPLVSDGVIAPGFSDNALNVLSAKKKGNYCVLAVDAAFEPPEIERREVFGVAFEQHRNDFPLTTDLLNNAVTSAKNVSEAAKRDLLLAMITLKFTQSNSVAYAFDGQAIGVGAGQQSRLGCTKLAGDKADDWAKRHGITLDSVALASDAFFPFADNIDRAAQSGVKFIAQPGGSIRDPDVIAACDKHGIAMLFTGVRLFTH
jgi:phosphoribosylaminoimidazolecarboxamide formyltransferase/IMP cyclohydrolase